MHVIPVMDPRTGGPPAVVAALLAYLPGTGIDGAVVCYDGWPGDGSRQRVEAMLASLPRPVPPPVWLPPLTRREVVTAVTARRQLPAAFAGADLVHIHGVWDAICPAAATAARRLGLPYVLSTHGMLEPWAVEGQGRLPRLKKWLRWRLGWREMLENAAGIHDYRPGPLTVLGHRLPTPVEVIANGISPPVSAGGAEGAAGAIAGHVVPSTAGSERGWASLTARYPALAGRRVLLSLGRLSVQKGTDTLAEAFAAVARHVPDAVLVLAGADYGLGAMLRRRHAGLLSSSRLVMPGAVLGEEKSALLERAVGFVLPSRHEGFSVAVLEAMAAGLPCVLSSACHFPEAEQAGAAWTVSPDDPAGLAETLRRLLALPVEARADMGRRGRELVLRHYTWPDIARRYAAWYGRCTRGGRSRVSSDV